MIRVITENQASVLSDYLARAIRMNEEEKGELESVVNPPDSVSSSIEFIDSDNKELRVLCGIVDDAIEKERLLKVEQVDY